MRTDNTDNTSGKRLTFFQLLIDYHLQIPIIQRDYAQGRITENEIRDSFLVALYDYLDENVKNRDLDFVYGNKTIETKDDNVKFIPLDGQQRLTTLFLLHWYLANKDGKKAVEELQKVLIYDKETENPKSKFTYETRPSSGEFCDALIKSKIELPELESSNKNNYLSETIKDSIWYFLSWETDPTIQSMLVMLDAIHLKFKDSKGFFERLISIENPVITFQFLDLEEFNLTDDLYIKMNARGIPLSPFENFKAKVEQFIKKSKFNNNHKYPLEFNGKIENVDTQTYFSHKIDTDWANLFWNYTPEDKKKFDSLIMNFIKATSINQYAGYSDIEFLKSLIDKKKENIPFQQYVLLDIFSETYIIDLISILDLLKNGNGKIKSRLSNFHYYNEETAFETVVQNSFNQAGYVERIQFHAYCQYLIKWKTDQGLDNWMRIIRNLSENTTPYNNEKEFARSIKFINEILPHSNKIYDYFIKGVTIDGFDRDQIREERIKATLIERPIPNTWKDIIYKIEKNGYFKGQIGFLLFLSGIEEYFNQHKDCNWSASEDINYVEAFTSHSRKSELIFSDSGLKDFPDFIWERALLSNYDYLIQEGSNQSFLVNVDRDISWKRLLKADKKPAIHKKLIREIFDEIDISNIESSLNLIKGKNQTNDWRKKFIDIPELFNYFFVGKRYVRKESNHGFVLFSGERMSGAHVELFSYSLFLQSFKNQSFQPFEKCEYYQAIGDDKMDSPCIYLEKCKSFGYVIDIRYFGDIKKFEVRFFERANSHMDSAIESKILKNGMIKSNKYSDDSYIIEKDTENETLDYVKTLCQSLNSL